MERERMKLALEDRPVRSEFEALNELHEDRLRTMEAELRRLIAELSNRVQVCRTEVYPALLLYKYRESIRRKTVEFVCLIGRKG